MKMTYNKYNAYKPTSIPWLKQIPGHWELKRAKFLFKVIDQRSKNGEEELLSVSEHYGVIPRKNANVTMFKAESYEGFKLCEKGDLVVNSLWAWSYGLGFSEYNGIISTAYSVYRLIENHNHRYFNYLLRTKIYSAEFFSRSKGIWISRLQLLDSSFLNIPILIPPPSEQSAIAAFLDHKTQLINRFINNKQKLILLLKEKKQAVINSAVSYDRNNWKKIKLKFVATVKTGRTPSIEKSNFDFFKDGNINWFTPGDFNNGLYLEESERKISKIAVDYNEVDIFKQDSIYLIGIGGTLGKVALIKMEASANQQINVITFNSSIFPDFALFFFLSIKEELLKTAEYTTLPILNQTKTKNILIPIPSLDSQQQIVNHIKTESKKIDAAISRIENEIELMKEYKQSLIAEVVTGKIKVS